MMFNVLGVNVVFGGALVSTVRNAYLRATELRFLCNRVYDSLDLSLGCHGEQEHVSCPTLHEHFE